jgi:hypothetical protein
MRKKRNFWSACESIPGLAAVEAEWRLKSGEQFDVAKVFVKPRQAPAKSIPCPAKEPCGCYHGIVRHDDGRIAAKCCCEPRSCDTAYVSSSDLVVYELDRDKLHQAISKVLSLNASEAAVPNLKKTTLVGFDSPMAGYSFPVYLTVQHDPEVFHAVVSAMAAQQTGPFILISPTDQFYSPTCRTLIETRNALFLTLSDIVSLPDGGRPVANPSAKGMMDVFHAAVLPAKEKHPPVDFFPTPSGSTWGDVHIHFDNDHVASIRVKTASGTYDFSRMGMVNRTSGKPSKQWELLLAFRDGHGWLTWESSQAHRRNKKRKQLLAESLQRFFRIDGDPFVYDEDAKGWCALFHFD